MNPLVAQLSPGQRDDTGPTEWGLYQMSTSGH